MIPPEDAALGREVIAGIVGQLAARRRALGLAQHQLAARTGMRQPEVAAIERGVTAQPRWGTLHAMARALGCTITITLDIPDDPNGEPAMAGKHAAPDPHNRATGPTEGGQYGWTCSCGQAKGGYASEKDAKTGSKKDHQAK